MTSPRVIAAFLVSLTLTGCAMPRRTWQPPRDPNTLDAMTFLHYLAVVPAVTVDEGMRAVLMLSDDGARFPTPSRRYAEMIRRGAIRESWQLAADQLLDKGTLGHMLRTACALPRGVNETLAGRFGWGDRRYALEVCVHEGLMPRGVAHEPVTGGELLTALTHAEQYLADRAGATP